MLKFKHLLAAGLAALLATAPAAWAGARLDKIMDAKLLRVGTPGDYRPFAIKDGTGYAGHDVDTIEAMAKVLGVKIEWVPTSWPNLMKDLQADKFDVAVGGITRNVARLRVAAMLPGYAPTSKVALVRAADKDKYKSLQDLDQPGVRVIKNPGGTNEAFVLEHLKAAQVSTDPNNAEIPSLIADGKGDVMITETYEALHYAKADPRLAALFIDKPLSPVNYVGFLMPNDDPDYLREMNFAWDLLAKRGTLKAIDEKWLQ